MKAFVVIGFIMPFIYFSANAQKNRNQATVTIQKSVISVGDLLESIRVQTGYNFSFNSKIIDTGQNISFFLRQASIEKAMETLREKTGITYQFVEGEIVLKPGDIQPKQTDVYHTITGFISDQHNGEVLIGATVMDLDQLSGAISNEFGYYALHLKPGKHQLQYGYIGYEPQTLEIEVKKDEQHQIALLPASIELPDVIVAQPTEAILEKKQLEHFQLSPEDLANMPEFAGESGLVKGLQSLPGIKIHSDGSAFMYTRGGERDQNLIIVDDAPIYNPAHLFGFYSLIIPDFAKSIEVYKSDFPASMGDQLSSIISIRTKDGNLNKFEMSGALNPLFSRFAVEVPVRREKGAIFATIRSSNLDWLYKKRVPTADLRFGDFQFKWNHRIDGNNRLFFTMIASGDNFTNSAYNGNQNAGIKWGNFAATFRWNHVFNSRLFANTTIFTGNYGYRLFFDPNYWQSALGTLAIKSDFTHFIRPNLETKFGFVAQGFYIDPGSYAIDTSIALLPKIQKNDNRKLALYYQAEWQPISRLKINAGIRLINWENRGPKTYYIFDDNHRVSDTIQAGPVVYSRYLNIDPRLSFQFQVDSTAQLRLSYGIYHQYLQLISNSISPFTSLEIWLPAGPNIKPQYANQFALHFLKLTGKKQLEWSLGLYYKKLFQQIDYKDHATTLLNPLIEGELRFGTSKAYGIETMLRKSTGKLHGWINYTYSRVFRQTDGINNNASYPAFQDRPHELSLLMNYQASNRLSFSGYWTAYSGSTFSSPTGFYRFNEQTIPVFDKKNNDRLPAYNRLDLSLKYTLNKDLSSRFHHSLTLSLYNALGHKNIVAVNFNKIPQEDGTRPLIPTDLLSEALLSPSQLDLIRFMPSLTYKFKY